MKKIEKRMIKGKNLLNIYYEKRLLIQAFKHSSIQAFINKT